MDEDPEEQLDPEYLALTIALAVLIVLMFLGSIFLPPEWWRIL